MHRGLAKSSRHAQAPAGDSRDRAQRLGTARGAYGGNRAETGLPVLGLGGTSWIEQLLDQAPGARVEAYAQPPAFDGTQKVKITP